MASTIPVLTIADLLEQFGPVPAARIRHDPPPGSATEQDVIDIEAREDKLYELIDGVLLEKTMGYYEAYLASLLARLIGNYADQHDLGIVAGADGALRLLPQQVRIPDVSFISWDRLPGRRLPAEPIPSLVPDLVVEVISAGNTPEEMDRKRREYLDAAVRMIWYVYPTTHTVCAYSGSGQMTELSQDAVLEGADVLPGFRLPLADLFAVPKEEN